MTMFDNSHPKLFDETELPSMSSVVDSRAKTSAPLAMDLALKENAAGCGANTQDSFAIYDHNSSSWRTSQRCFIADWTEFSETWPASGMMRNGRVFQRAPWVTHTCDDDCGSWPTPTASMDGRGFGIPLHDRSGRYSKKVISRVHALVREHGWRIHPNFTEALMGFPTDHTAIEPSETPLCQTSPNSSGEQS